MAMVFSEFFADAPAARAGDGPFYVSLGDSLSVGYQPGRGETRKGYVDDLWRSVRETIPGLETRKFGCPGETSRSMITGNNSPCEYVAASQLDAAVAFLGRHGGEVPFITIDIGVNDIVNRCLDFRTGLLDKTCVMELRPRLEDRLTRIVGDLSGAAGPDVPILGMTYYDPFLGFWGLVPDGHLLARKSERSFEVFNAAGAAAYGSAGAVVADVAETFRIDDFSRTVILHGRGRVPINVALTCRWSWFCSQKYFGDPHANAIGYRKIARTFHRELKPLLP